MAASGPAGPREAYDRPLESAIGYWCLECHRPVVFSALIGHLPKPYIPSKAASARL
jgi:hypothetical protein